MTININHVSKLYDQQVILKDFSYIINDGQIITIKGPSGCGKTTLLKMIMGLETPTEGTIIGVPKKRSAVFQESRLFDSFNPIENIMAVSPKTISKEEIISDLSRLGLSEDLDKPVRSFSGGMRRRVEIVRAMIVPSDIVFLDEPYKGLDYKTKEIVIDYVIEKINGRTVIFISHENIEIEKMKGDNLRLY